MYLELIKYRQLIFFIERLTEMGAWVCDIPSLGFGFWRLINLIPNYSSGVGNPLLTLGRELYNSVFFRAPCWYIDPTAMPREAVTPIAIGRYSRLMHCRRDDIPAWRPNKLTSFSVSSLDLTIYHDFISVSTSCSIPVWRQFNTNGFCNSESCRWIPSFLR